MAHRGAKGLWPENTLYAFEKAVAMGVDVLDYFKALAEETGIPYQNLINSYLRDCVVHQKKPSMKWAS